MGASCSVNSKVFVDDKHDDTHTLDNSTKRLKSSCDTVDSNETLPGKLSIHLAKKDGQSDSFHVMNYGEFFQNMKINALSLEEADSFVLKHSEALFAVDRDGKDIIQYAIERGNLPMFRLMVQRKNEAKFY